jgi:hypothetical protein
MKTVTERDLERTQTGTTDRPHAAATGSGCLYESGRPDCPDEARDERTGRTPEERAADAWTGQYPEAPARPAGECGPAAAKDPTADQGEAMCGFPPSCCQGAAPRPPAAAPLRL